jgi:hypothetical protein
VTSRVPVVERHLLWLPEFRGLAQIVKRMRARDEPDAVLLGLMSRRGRKSSPRMSAKAPFSLLEAIRRTARHIPTGRGPTVVSGRISP